MWQNRLAERLVSRWLVLPTDRQTDRQTGARHRSTAQRWRAATQEELGERARPTAARRAVPGLTGSTSNGGVVSMGGGPGATLTTRPRIKAPPSGTHTALCPPGDQGTRDQGRREQRPSGRRVARRIRNRKQERTLWETLGRRDVRIINNPEVIPHSDHWSLGATAFRDGKQRRTREVKPSGEGAP